MRKYLVYMSLLGLIELTIVLYLSFWRETFWNFVESHNFHGFLVYLTIFTVVALVLCFTTSLSTYLGTLIAIEWRKMLNTKAMAVDTDSVVLDNVNQRVQEDCKSYPELIISIGAGLIRAISYIIVFSATLIYSFGIKYLIFISLYAIVSTLIAKRIGFPLIKLNYQSQQAEATYRNKLSVKSFFSCITIQILLAQKLKRLQYFQSFYGQLGVVIPLIIVSPIYFTTGMTIGTLMRITSTMSTISENLSYGINNFDVFNRLLSCRKRLKELEVL